jgi:viroplasmin and RNaseH domain-containing protein
MSVGKQMQQLLEVMMLLKSKVTLLEETERQRVMQLEALRNREVATRRREDKEKEKVARTKEEEIGVKQQAIQHELEKVFDQVEVQIMEVSNKVAKEEKETVKHTNYHYQQKQKPMPPKAPQNPQKPL